MATETHGAEEAVAMPQLDPSSFPNQIFWLVVALFAIYLILTRSALPRIASVLAERRGTITNDVAAAEELKLKAQEAERAYEQALADAREEAAEIIAKARKEMRADLDAALQRADAQISAKTDESEKRIAEIRASAEKSVAEVARDTSEAVVAALGGKADAKLVAEAVSNRMKG